MSDGVMANLRVGQIYSSPETIVYKQLNMINILHPIVSIV